MLSSETPENFFSTSESSAEEEHVGTHPLGYPPYLYVRESLIEEFRQWVPFSIPAAQAEGDANSVSYSSLDTDAPSGDISVLSEDSGHGKGWPELPGGYTSAEMDEWGLTFGRGKYWNAINGSADGDAFARYISHPPPPKPQLRPSRSSVYSSLKKENSRSDVSREALHGPRLDIVSKSLVKVKHATSKQQLQTVRKPMSPPRLKHKPSTIQRILQKIVHQSS